jgi:hypothetical protein
MVYLAVLMQSYAFSGKEKDVDFLLLKAKPRARARPCELYDGDGASGWISWRYDIFFEDGMWMTPHGDISAANYKLMMSEEAYGCIIQCFSADENANTVPPLQFGLQWRGPFLPLFGPIQWW